MKKLTLLPFLIFVIVMNVTVWRSTQTIVGDMVRIAERPVTVQAVVTEERVVQSSKSRSASRFITYKYVVEQKEYVQEAEDVGEHHKGEPVQVTYCQTEPSLSIPGLPRERIARAQRGRQFLFGFDVLLGAVLLLALRRMG